MSNLASVASVAPLRVQVSRVGDVGDVPLPRYQTPGSAGMDLHAALKQPVVLAPREAKLIPTGLAFAIPIGWEGQVRPRSGLAARHGITVLNAPGTVDSDFRGEVCVLLVNFGHESFTVKPFERIAQMVFAQHGTAELEVVTSLDDTTRGAGGYGSTGR
jgi:dUTP pyrophosphatase